MPGLYVHIPFCARRCPYCDFAVSVNKRVDFRASYVAALQKELHLTLSDNAIPLETVFFGGGTPTELSASTLNQILSPVLSITTADAEISLEANPENLDAAYLGELRDGGFNRLSLGAQSFNPGELQFLGRAHNERQIEQVVRDAKSVGFDNISLDLIYGSPGTTTSSWRQTLQCAIALDLQHISAYCLTIEDGTAFGHQVKRGDWTAPDDEFLGELMEVADETLSAAGFGRYEVSNWAKAGFESRHNRNYWRGGNYLGVGCGAHGHRDGERYWNERDAKIYVQRIENEGIARAGAEKLSPHEQAMELVALGLRCREGFSLSDVSRTGEFDASGTMNGQLASFVKMGVLREEKGRILPTPQSMSVADGLAARLIGQF